VVHVLELKDQNSFSLLPAGERRVLQFIDEDKTRSTQPTKATESVRTRTRTP